MSKPEHAEPAMRRSVLLGRLVVAASIALMALIIYSCAGDGLTGPRDQPIARKAKPSGGNVTVSLAEPDSGAQGAVNLVVKIHGSGFSRDAVADWERNGAPDAKITVSSTRFVSASEVDATISIAADAELATYDVAVTSGGKKGIGTELFAVTLADPTATWYVPVDDPALGFQGDRGDTAFTIAGVTSSYARYRDSECGVSAVIYSTTSQSGTGDATIRTDRSGRKGCSRSFRLNYQDGSAETLRSFNNLNDLQSALVQIPVGGTQRRRLIIGPGGLSNNPSRCGRLLFGQNDGPNGLVGAGTDSLNVTRLNGSTWVVQSQAGSTSTLCEDTGELLHMPVRFVIEASRSLP
jgi:hypothetical protein